MNTTAKIVIFPQQTKKGYPLKIRVIQDRKPVYFTLKYFLTESQRSKYWNETKKELRKSYPYYEKVISEYESKLKELGLNKDETETEINISNNIQSFTDYYKAYLKALETKKQFGLLQKANSIFLNLNHFCREYNLPENIHFRDLNIDLLNNFQLWMVKKNIKAITQKGYFEKIRSIINKAIKENKYNPNRHPFLGFEFIRVDTKTKCLNPEQFRQLKDYVIKTNDRTALKFLFQYYSFGMRVSDLLLLKWGNIEESGTRLKYTMYKTKEQMDIALNTEQLDILYHFMNDDLQNEIELISKLPRRQKILKERLAQSEIKFIYDIKDRIEGDRSRHSVIRLYLHQLSINKNNERIFSPIPDGDKKTIFSKISTYTAVYNKDLKELSKVINGGFHLSSHMARHTFAYLSLLSGQSVYYISQALKHKTIKTTEVYLKGFPSRQLDDKFYKPELSVDEKRTIDEKLREFIYNADYERKKKMLELLGVI